MANFDALIVTIQFNHIVPWGSSTGKSGLSRHPRSGWAQEAPAKEAGISNIDTMNFEMMVLSLWNKMKIEHSDTALQYSFFYFHAMRPWQ